MQTPADAAKPKPQWSIEPFAPGASAWNWREVQSKSGTLYILECGGLVKIGMSRNFEKRLATFRGQIPIPVTKIAIRTVPYAGLIYAEAWMHAQFADKRVKGEWFSIRPDDAKVILPAAVQVAKAYTARCKAWHEENVRLHSFGKLKEKSDREKAEFFEKYAKMKEATDFSSYGA